MAVSFGPAWTGVGIAMLVLSAAWQIWRRKQILESCVGNVAGFTLAMWGIQVTGHQRGAFPNVRLAIILVAIEIIVVLLVESWRRGQAEGGALTSPPGDS